MTINTQSELAKHLGVSTRLVVSAFSGKGRIGEETRQRILSTARELGYEPNRAARALVKGRTNVITLALPALSSSFNTRIVRAVEAAARASSYDLMVTGINDPGYTAKQQGEDRHGPTISASDTARPLDNLNITPWPTDGMLLIEAQFLEPQPWHRGTIFRAFTGGTFRRAASHDHIVISLHTGAREAMELLTARARRVAFLGGVVSCPGEARIKVYREVIQATGRIPEVIACSLGQGVESRAATVETLKRYAQIHGMPDALYCSNDEVALGAYRVIRQMGLRPGEDVLVTGCDGGPESQDAYPELTTIHQPVEEVCARLWGMLIERIEKPELESRQGVYEARLIRRGSSGV